MLKIDFRLTGSGWAECTVHADGCECEVSASYLSDALGKLVLAGVAVLADAQSVAVGFDEEPGEYRWAIVLQHLSLYEYGQSHPGIIEHCQAS